MKMNHLYTTNFEKSSLASLSIACCKDWFWRASTRNTFMSWSNSSKSAICWRKRTVVKPNAYADQTTVFQFDQFSEILLLSDTFSYPFFFILSAKLQISYQTSKKITFFLFFDKLSAFIFPRIHQLSIGLEPI